MGLTLWFAKTQMALCVEEHRGWSTLQKKIVRCRTTTACSVQGVWRGNGGGQGKV
jgi:hypothetical protein